MSVTQTLRVVEIVRGFGVPVTFEPGWDTRGNGQSSAYQGGIVHHTGGSYANVCPGILIHGRSDLSGPLCNYAGLTGGGLHVVAAHPANHAGASGGPSTHPFPVTTLFNKLVMGLEICYPGAQPMTDAQYRTAKAFAKAMQIMFGDIERARAHAETSREGKWDAGFAPGRTINMAAFRAEAARIQEVDDLTPDQSKKLDEVHGKIFSRFGLEGRPTEENEDLYGHILNIGARVQKLETSGVPVDVRLSEQDADRVAELVADKIAERMRD